MNKTPTYQEQWQKITSAYLNNKLKPWDACACFIGNLLNNKGEWVLGRDIIGNVIHSVAAERCVINQSHGYYSMQEIATLERNFLDKVIVGQPGFMKYNEDALFHAMTSTLEMLKGIHEKNGEVVDPIEFNKRFLV